MNTKSLASQLDEHITKILLKIGFPNPTTKIEKVQQRKEYVYIKINLFGDPLDHAGFSGGCPFSTHFVIKYYNDDKIYADVVQTVDKWRLKNFKYKQPALKPSSSPLIEGERPKITKIKYELQKELKENGSN